ncbi:MAG: thiamine pyrophosphate-dependent dehydrogenase E1 component subunit alpha [Sandaracinus sp.]|nr:thiamine pyrophosphate-dependent dehydrogenase E1 component subunit alpha [Sandaracinus sp.]
MTDDPALGLYQVLQDDGSVDEAHDPKLDDETLLRLFRHMVHIRIVDERMLARQRQGKVGFYGASTGQEATPIVTGMLLQEQDWVFQALREGAIMLVRGFPLDTWLAQIYGNEGDVAKGRQMPMHMSGRAVNHVSWSSCLGPQLPQAVGMAWAAKLKGHEDVISVAFTGDGATSEPDFHAAMNFAGVYKPPCVIVCQNNHWAISVPVSKQTASPTFAIKARAYGLPGIRVDGNDVLALWSVLSAAFERARKGEGPTFVEALTYRIGAHSSSDDPTRYRSEEEVERWRQKDPIARFERYLRAKGLVTDDSRKALEEEITAEVLEAIRKVEEHGLPARETVLDDVFVERPWHLEEQRQELLAGPVAPKAAH